MGKIEKLNNIYKAPQQKNTIYTLHTDTDTYRHTYLHHNTKQNKTNQTKQKKNKMKKRKNTKEKSSKKQHKKL